MNPADPAQTRSRPAVGNRRPGRRLVQGAVGFGVPVGARDRREVRGGTGGPWAMVALLGLAACGGLVGGGGTSDTGGGSASSGTSDGSSTSAAQTGAGESGASSTTSAGETGFLDGGETGWGWWCDVWLQDCPPGEKCMPYARDGSSKWHSTICVPVAPDPKQPGEVCTAEGGGLSGIDDCAKASMCWNVDDETNMGTCVPFCMGTPDAPMCADPADTCVIANDGVLILCLPRCDPLLQDCSENEVCIPVSPGDGFACVLDASGGDGVAGTPCRYANSCNPGLLCRPGDLVPGCLQNGACCVPLCDLTDPNASQTCAAAYTEPGAECVPFFEMGTAPPEYEDVGVCLLPS